MGRDPHIAAAFHAVSVCLSVKADRASREDVEALRIQARDTLDEGNQLRAAIEDFARRFAAQAYSRRAQQEAAEQLHQYVERFCRPDPVDAHRKDIYG